MFNITRDDGELASCEVPSAWTFEQSRAKTIRQLGEVINEQCFSDDDPLVCGNGCKLQEIEKNWGDLLYGVRSSSVDAFHQRMKERYNILSVTDETEKVEVVVPAPDLISRYVDSILPIA